MVNLPVNTYLGFCLSTLLSFGFTKGINEAFETRFPRSKQSSRTIAGDEEKYSAREVYQSAVHLIGNNV
jgi:hypothetical protein